MTLRQSRPAANQVAHHEDARPIDSASTHGAKASTGHRWIPVYGRFFFLGFRTRTVVLSLVAFPARSRAVSTTV